MANGKNSPIPNRLRELRQERGLTLDEVGLKVGYTHATASRHESGQTGLDGTAIDRYCRVYGVHPLDLWFTPLEVELVLKSREDEQEEPWVPRRETVVQMNERILESHAKKVRDQEIERGLKSGDLIKIG